jgi:D-glycero-beta-D-manno-heptose 1-phosphate adenylyltransferase
MQNLSEYIKSKILTREQLQKEIVYWNFRDQKIVFTNGCFDILHKGHVDYLQKAKQFGNILIIGLNTDSSIKRIKGKDRPLQNEETRASVLASLVFVSAVVLFEEDTPKNLIESIRPDFLVKGADYAINQIVGADFVQGYGGRVVTIELTESYSTTSIVNKIIAAK